MRFLANWREKSDKGYITRSLRNITDKTLSKRVGSREIFCYGIIYLGMRLATTSLK